MKCYDRETVDFFSTVSDVFLFMFLQLFDARIVIAQRNIVRMFFFIAISLYSYIKVRILR